MDFEKVEGVFVEAVKEKIYGFNETRGRRKELAPDIVETIYPPYRKFGRILDCGEAEISETIIDKMAGATVRTLLLRKPRPSAIAVDVLHSSEGKGYLFRLKVPRIKQINN